MSNLSPLAEGGGLVFNFECGHLSHITVVGIMGSGQLASTRGEEDITVFETGADYHLLGREYSHYLDQGEFCLNVDSE